MPDKFILVEKRKRNSHDKKDGHAGLGNEQERIAGLIWEVHCRLQGTFVILQIWRVIFPRKNSIAGYLFLICVFCGGLQICPDVHFLLLHWPSSTGVHEPLQIFGSEPPQVKLDEAVCQFVVETAVKVV